MKLCKGVLICFQDLNVLLFFLLEKLWSKQSIPKQNYTEDNYVTKKDNTVETCIQRKLRSKKVKSSNSWRLENYVSKIMPSKKHAEALLYSKITQITYNSLKKYDTNENYSLKNLQL